MNNSDFTHLHVHSEYSLLDGLGKPEHYIERAKELGFKALAVTDHGNIDAHLKWQRVCKKNEFIPIFGCELYVVEDMQKKEKKEIRKHMTVLVKNLEGWQALARILTISNLEGFYGKPRIDGRTLLDNVNDGLIVMTGCAGSFLSLPQGESLLVGLRDKGVNCYLEVMPHTIQLQIDINQICIGMNQKYNIPFVATNDCHYVRAEHAKAQEVLLAVQRQAKWKDPDRWRFEFDGLHLRTADEMIQKFKEQGTLSRSQYTKAMINTRVVADQCCNFRLPKQNINLPLTPYEKEYSDMTADEILAQFCSAKREEMQLSGQWQFEYRSRYAHEMEIIRRKEFARYFLIVYEIVEWCKKNGVMVGPGRGSVGGSLVAYLLNITQVDPLRYDLLFERFISEDRIDYPDIDLDFEDVKCHLVRQHLEERYGQYNVVGISTFLTMKGRAVIRDVGRVFDLPVEDVDSFAKSIRAEDHEEDIILNAGQETKEGKHFAQKYPEEFHLACILEGQIRGAGQHPAGLILSGRDLRNGENCALYRRSNALVCNWDMEDCERNGLIKIDILKVSTLTVLNEAKRLIFQNVGNILYYHPESECYLIGKTKDVTDELADLGEFDYSLLPLNDRKVFDMLSQGDTSGVFQFSGYACTDLCKQMGIDNFEDMAVVTALARPGPAESGMTSLYVRRKKGEQWEPLHPAYEAITKNTYGVMVYQEQMMRAMTDLAGFSNSDADRIRKVIGKKRKIEEFEPYRLSFLEGCQRKRTLTNKQVVEFWEGLLAWSHYGFNKCLVGDTELMRGSANQYTGRTVKLKDLYLDWHQNSPVGSAHRWRGLGVLQMSDDGRCRPGKVIGVFYQGKKEVFEVMTQTGKKIKGTGNHRLHSYEEYKTIAELNVGDRLAVMGSYQKTIYEKKGQQYNQVDTKGRCGFQKGKDNLTYVDGRTDLLERVKKKVLKRSKEKCEKCSVKNSPTGYQFAHIVSPIEEFNGNYSRYHSEENMLYLCQSCHHLLDYEKGERKKRYSKGYPIYYDPIISVKKCGIEEVFDVEVEGPNHNFIANGIVSHNSHAVEYAMIGYYTAWLKVYHLTEFFCAQLTYGVEKEGVVREAERKGMKIVTPKVGVSDARRWIARKDLLYMPFIEINGVGENQADKCALIKISSPKISSRKGFFELKRKPAEEIEAKTKLEKLMLEICAFNPDPLIGPEEPLNYFQYSIGQGGSGKKEIEVIRKQMLIDPSVRKCVACSLRQQASQVVLSSLGMYNVLALGEASGREEDAQGMGFVGDAGKVLWDEIVMYGITRRMIHVGNCCKCWPSKSQTPSFDEIRECFNRWMIKEILSMDCRLILATGNTPLYALVGRDSGITSLSGQMEWVEKVKAWVVWCVHPSAVLRNRRSNLGPFQKGIRTFAEAFNRGIEKRRKV